MGPEEKLGERGRAVGWVEALDDGGGPAHQIVDRELAAVREDEERGLLEREHLLRERFLLPGQCGVGAVVALVLLWLQCANAGCSDFTAEADCWPARRQSRLRE